MDPTETLTGNRGASRRLKLCVAAGPDFGAQLILDRGSCRVGKASDADLVLHDGSVSREHLFIDVLEDSIRVTDVGSRNGTFLRNSRIERAILRPGESLRVGRTVLRLLPVEQATSPLKPSEHSHFGELVGRSIAMREVFAALERIAASRTDVLILGETGTGKELCARSLHARVQEHRQRFVVCDLAALPPTLAESELFGHVKGAFTGATSAYTGVFERASGGTLFLDEVGELPLPLQTRLLRVLDQKAVKRIGASAYQPVDFWLMAATHRDLTREVHEGRFREDLFHRLSAVCVRLPPLRERPEDVSPMIDALLERMNVSPALLSDVTRSLLEGYGWPGNARELRNVVSRIINLGDDPALDPTPTRGVATRPAEEGAEAIPSFKHSKERLLLAFERDYLRALLLRCEGNISRAARLAGIDRVHVHKLLKKHGIAANSA